MTRIHILTTRSTKSILYLFPLRRHRTMLHDEGLRIEFFYSLKPQAMEADWVVIDCNFQQEKWGGNSGRFFEFLTKAKRSCDVLAWLDTTASTSVLHPEAMPFVDVYFKGLLLREKEQYLRPFYSKRIFADYYHVHDGVRDDEEVKSLPLRKEDLAKLQLLWNYSFGGFSGMRTRFFNVLRQAVPSFPYFYSVRFVSPHRQRTQDVSCRLNLNYGKRTSIAYQRQQVVRILQAKMDIDPSRLGRRAYYREMKKARIIPSPFGWGEINYRDFEVMIAGAALMKPDMNHMETWPDLFQKDVTYISHAWDLSDMVDKIRHYLDNKRYAGIAEAAQEAYGGLLTEKKEFETFGRRAREIFNKE